MKKIKKIAALINEPLWFIQDALGLLNIDHSSLSLNDLKIIFRDSSAESEEEFCCLKEIARRIEEQILSAELNKVREAYFLANELDLEDLKLKALKNWDELSLKEVRGANNYEEIRIACERSPRAGFARLLAHQKKEKIIIRLYDEAKNLEDFIDLYKKTPKNSPHRKKIIQKLYKLLDS